jgi:hypothetical protein
LPFLKIGTVGYYFQQGAPDISAPLNNKAWKTKSDILGRLEPLFGFTYITLSDKK